jgi:hypothetical protein
MQAEAHGDSAVPPRRPWYTHPAVAGPAVIATIVSLFVGAYFGWASSRARELCWYVSQPRPLVQRGQDPTPLEVRFAGRPIEHDVYVLQVQVWNEGRLEIEGSDVLSPVIVQVRDGSGPAAILDVKILSSTRPETHFALVPPIETDGGSVSVSWRILERRDGGLVQLVCASGSAPTVSMSGSIKGQRRVRRVQNPATKSGPRSVLETLVLVVGTTLFVQLLSKFGGFVWRTSWRSTAKGYLAIVLCSAAAFALLLGVMLLFNPPLPPFRW